MATSWPDLAALELLVAVADHGSLSRGARAVGAAQANASRSIARLERRLGLRLLQRATTGSTLTPAGLLVVEWSRETLVAARSVLDGAAALAGDDDGSLRVVASQTVAEHLLPRWLAAFRGAHPQARVAVEVGNTATTLDRVRSGTCDVGFVEGPTAPRGVRHTVVAHDELVLVADPSHPWARRGRPVRDDELASGGLVTRETGSGTRAALEATLGREVLSSLELPSNAAVRVAVSSGAGPSVLSLLAVADAVRSGALVRVDLERGPLRRPLRAVWSGPRRPAGAAGELVALARSSRDTTAAAAGDPSRRS